MDDREGFDVEMGEEVEVKKLPNDVDYLEQYFSNLPQPIFEAMESRTNSWAVYRFLERLFEKLFVVDPAAVRGRDIRRRARTDRRDARKLALKMYRGELDPLYIPDEKTQDQRVLGRVKINATRRVTKLVNEIGSLLRSWGVLSTAACLARKARSWSSLQSRGFPSIR